MTNENGLEKGSHEMITNGRREWHAGTRQDAPTPNELEWWIIQNITSVLREGVGRDGCTGYILRQVEENNPQLCYMS